MQRAIVRALRLLLPKGSIVHHSANEVGRGGAEGRRRQAVLAGMGVHAGFSDLIVLAEGRVVFLEVKSAAGRPTAAQRAFGEAVRAQGHGFAVARSVDEALGALAAHGIATRERGMTRERGCSADAAVRADDAMDAIAARREGAGRVGAAQTARGG